MRRDGPAVGLDDRPASAQSDPKAACLIGILLQAGERQRPVEKMIQTASVNPGTVVLHRDQRFPVFR